MKPEDFYTKPACNTPQRLTLYLPDGKDSGEWIEVYGIDSDAYEAAIAETQQKLLAMDIAISIKKAKALENGNSPEEFDKLASELQKLGDERQVIASERDLENKVALVAGWSFKREFSKESVMELLKNSPQIAQSLDRFISNRMNFLKKK